MLIHVLIHALIVGRTQLSLAHTHNMTSSVWVILGVLALSTAIGLIWKHRSGTFRSAEPSASAIDPSLLAQVEVDPSAHSVTIVQFSSKICAYCRAARELSTAIAAARPDVVHIEVDAEEHLDAVRSLGIMRTPTLLILDRRGVEVSRASGLPDQAAIEAAVDSVTGSLRAER